MPLSRRGAPPRGEGAFLDRSDSSVRPAGRTSIAAGGSDRGCTHDCDASDTLTLGRWRSSVSLWLCSVRRLSLSSCIAERTHASTDRHTVSTQTPRPPRERTRDICTYTACEGGWTWLGKMGWTGGGEERGRGSLRGTENKEASRSELARRHTQQRVTERE